MYEMTFLKHLYTPHDCLNIHNHCKRSTVAFVRLTQWMSPLATFIKVHENVIFLEKIQFGHFDDAAKYALCHNKIICVFFRKSK